MPLTHPLITTSGLTLVCWRACLVRGDAGGFLSPSGFDDLSPAPHPHLLIASQTSSALA